MALMGVWYYTVMMTLSRLGSPFYLQFFDYLLILCTNLITKDMTVLGDNM